MGCGYISKEKIIKSKEVDLSEEITNVYQKDVINNLNIVTETIFNVNKICLSNKKNSKSIKKQKLKKIKNIESEKKVKIEKLIKKENHKPILVIDSFDSQNLDLSGPIINLLKNKVEKYKKKKIVQ